MGGVLFEELGFTYFGPVDGHDIKELTDVMRKAKSLDEPVLIHVITKKERDISMPRKLPANSTG